MGDIIDFARYTYRRRGISFLRPVQHSIPQARFIPVFIEFDKRKSEGARTLERRISAAVGELNNRMMTALWFYHASETGCYDEALWREWRHFSDNIKCNITDSNIFGSIDWVTRRVIPLVNRGRLFGLAVNSSAVDISIEVLYKNRDSDNVIDRNRNKIYGDYRESLLFHARKILYGKDDSRERYVMRLFKEMLLDEDIALVLALERLRGQEPGKSIMKCLGRQK